MSSKMICQSKCKQEMQMLITQIETDHKAHINKNHSKFGELTEILPSGLYNRVNRIIDMSEYDVDMNVTDADSEEEDEYEKSVELKQAEQSFNESTMSEVLVKDMAYDQLELKIEPKSESRSPADKKLYWLAEYIKKPKKDRIIWPSKIYNFDKKFEEKTLYEQSEYLMDIAAEEFTEWVNALGSDKSNNITKESIKQLFAIGVEGDTSKALYIEPKQVKAIPKDIAASFNMPEISIENNFERILNLDKRLESKPPKFIAFGRALPINMKEPGISKDTVKSVELQFPEEIRTTENVFKGITHLRSTRHLVDYLQENSDIPKPKYLVKAGVFEAKPPRGEIRQSQMPFYLRLLK